MAVHIIHTSSASGTPYEPSVIPGEYNNTLWIDFTKPGSQDTITSTSAFLIKFKRPIDLEQLSGDNFKLYKILEESPLVTSEVVGAFNTINTTTDYDSISRELTLTLAEALSSLQEYFFVISGLKDTTGLVQVDDHIVLFVAAGTGVTYEADNKFDIDQVIIEDYTLVSPPAVYGSGTTSVMTCTPANGTIGVASNTSTITITCSEELDTDNISVTEENLETGVVTTLDIEVEQDEGSHTIL